jgi:Ni/Co efflux regulator RcnB
MRKFLIAAVAASTLFSGTAMAAPYQSNDGRGRIERQDDRGRQQVRHNQHRRSQQANFRSFRTGDRFDQRQARNYREIRNPRPYGFLNAARGQHWVQSGNDALLVGITSGIVAAVIANAF